MAQAYEDAVEAVKHMDESEKRATQRLFENKMTGTEAMQERLAELLKKQRENEGK